MIPLIDQLVRSKRRTIAIIIQPDGTVIVRAPFRAPEQAIWDFVASKSSWIAKKKAELVRRAIHRRKQFVEGEKFLFLGKNYPLILVDGQREALAFDEAFYLSKKAAEKASSIFKRWYRNQAHRILTERVRQYSIRFGFQYEKVRISSARTRWGSCSPKGTLSFTWRLVMAPSEVIDYVVIHELVHLKIKNHSKQFWTGVGKYLPGYKVSVAWLRKNGSLLDIS